MSDINEKMLSRLQQLEREVERLRVGEKINKALLDTYYLGITAKAADSDKLDGLHSTDFMLSSYKDGWIPVSGTWTYASATTITVPSGAAAIYKVGMGIRLTQSSTVKFFYIVGVTDTVLTVTGGSDYTLEDATISAVSYTNSPDTAIGFPDWFNWTPTQTGWTALPSGAYRYCLRGKTCQFYIDITSGTSNGTTTRLTLPLMPKSGVYWGGANGMAMDNGAVLSVASKWYVNSADGKVYFGADMGSGLFTASGTKRVRCEGFYEIA